jgi:hypothetical protein
MPLQRLRQVDAYQQRRQVAGGCFGQAVEQRTPGQRRFHAHHAGPPRAMAGGLVEKDVQVTVVAACAAVFEQRQPLGDVRGDRGAAPLVRSLGRWLALS